MRLFGLRGARALAALAAGLLLCGCEGDAITIPDTEDPVLYLVLGQMTQASVFGREPEQRALLVESGSPTSSARFVEADRFEMRRALDGARFDWRYRADYDEVGSYPGARMRYANYLLADTASGAGLGSDALEPMETYRLTIEANGVIIRGTATIPERFEIELIEQEGRRLAVWPAVDGAAAYTVSAYPYPFEMQEDTVWEIPEDVPDGRSVRVQAIDENLYRYMTDDQMPRSGIDAGYGIFGAVTTAQLALPLAPR